MHIDHGTMIMVIDGAKMSLFRNRGKGLAADLDLVEHDAAHAESTTELGTDKPGRSFGTTGRARSAYQSSDYHQAKEDDFAKLAAAKLNELAYESDMDFIVVAAPRVLGIMRPQFNSGLRKRLVAEIAKDYAGRPAADIAELLRHHEA